MERLNASQITADLQRTTTELDRSPRSSTATRTISPERHAALFGVINKVRLLNGWTTRTAKELDATIRTWDEVISQYKIPVDAYSELYKRAFDTRQIALRNGKEPPNFDATLFVSGWTGEYGLAAEWRKRDIASGRYLEANAPSDCDLCFGTGVEVVPGKGARTCKHGNE